MCDEYDDERMKAFWRAIAANEGLNVLPVREEETEPIVKPIGFEATDVPKPRPKALVR